MVFSKKLMCSWLLLSLSFCFIHAMEEDQTEAPQTAKTTAENAAGVLSNSTIQRIIDEHIKPAPTDQTITDEIPMPMVLPNFFNDGRIVPSLQQTRPGGSITAYCGYYALYNALAFLNDSLNRLDRNQLCTFFDKALHDMIEIRKHGSFDNLMATELRKLIQKIPDTQHKSIAVLSINQLAAIARGVMDIAETFKEDTETLNLLQRFANEGPNRINSIAVIVGLGDQNGHWIALHVTRNTDQTLTIKLADSIGRTTDWTKPRLDESILPLCILLETPSAQWQQIFTNLRDILFDQNEDDSTPTSSQATPQNTKSNAFIKEPHLNRMFTIIQLVNELLDNLMGIATPHKQLMNLPKSLPQKMLNILSQDLSAFLNQFYNTIGHPIIRDGIDPLRTELEKLPEILNILDSLNDTDLQDSDKNSRIERIRDHFRIINTLCIRLDKLIEVIPQSCQSQSNGKNIAALTPLHDLIASIDDIFASLHGMIARHNKVLQLNQEKKQKLLQSFDLFDNISLNTIDFLREISDNPQSTIDAQSLFQMLNDPEKRIELETHFEQINQNAETIETFDAYLIEIRQYFRTMRQQAEAIIKALNPLKLSDQPTANVNMNTFAVPPTDLSELSDARMRAAFEMYPNQQNTAKQIFAETMDTRWLFKGIPGTGKSILAEAIAKKVRQLDIEAGRPAREIYEIPAANQKNQYKDSFEGIITATLDPLSKAKGPHHPIVIIDEMDAIGRDKSTQVSESKALNRYSADYPVHIIAIVNDENRLEGTLKNRFGSIEIPCPTPAQLKICLKQLLEERPAGSITATCTQEESLDNIVKHLPKGSVQRDCRTLIQTADLLIQNKPLEQRILSQDDLLKAAESMKINFKTKLYEFAKMAQPYAQEIGLSVATEATFVILKLAGPKAITILKLLWQHSPSLLKLLRR